MVRLPVRTRDIIFAKVLGPSLGLTQFYTRGLLGVRYLGVKYPDRDYNHFRLPSGEVRNARSYNFTPPHTFHAVTPLHCMVAVIIVNKQVVKIFLDMSVINLLNYGSDSVGICASVTFGGFGSVLGGGGGKKRNQK